MKDNMKEVRNLDAFILEKLDSGDFVFENEAWELMENKLDTPPSRFHNYLLKLIIPVVAVVTTVYIVYALNTDQSEVLSENISTEQENSVISNTNSQNETSTALTAGDNYFEEQNLAQDSDDLTDSDSQIINSQPKNNVAAQRNLNTSNRSNDSNENSAQQTSDNTDYNGEVNASTSSSVVKEKSVSANNDPATNQPSIKTDSNTAPTNEQDNSIQELANKKSNEIIKEVSDQTDEKTFSSDNTTDEVENVNTDSEVDKRDALNNQRSSEKDNNSETGMESISNLSLEKLPFENSTVEYLKTEIKYLDFARSIREAKNTVPLIKPLIKRNKLYIGIMNSALWFNDFSGNEREFQTLSDFYVGYNYLHKGDFINSAELWYSRIPNSQTIESFYGKTDGSTLRILGFDTRESIDVISSFSWRPKHKRFSIRSNIGFGLTYHSLLLKSEVSPPSGEITVPTFVNQNKIYMKADPHYTLGLIFSIDIIPGRWAFITAYNQRMPFSSIRKVNGELQGYKINPMDNQAEYETFEKRVTENYNYGALLVGFEFYIF